MTSLKTLLRRESELVLEAKAAAEAMQSDVFLRLAENRIAIGEKFLEEKAKAEKEKVPWPDWCEERLGLGRPQADKYCRIAAAKTKVIELAKNQEFPVNMDYAVRLLPSQAESRKLAYASGGQSDRDSDHWITPPEFIEAARAVMGSIDFDPFSSPEGNAVVKAAQYYTVDDDAFETPWPTERCRKVWMNPPYGRGNVQKAVAALLEHIEEIDEAIVLVNNATETRWFRDLWDSPRCTGVVFTYKRIAFISPGDDKTVSGNTRGQVLFYFGADPKRFCEIFGQCGKFLRVTQSCEEARSW